VKPNINSGEVHSEPCINGHPADGALVGAGSLWPNPERKGKEGIQRPMSKAETMPKKERKEKTLAQIQTPSLTPKPLISSMKQIRQREGRERGSSLKEALLVRMAHLNMLIRSTKERLQFSKLTMPY
jgi:hypothetical protein